MLGATLGICAPDFKGIKLYERVDLRVLLSHWVGPREEASYVSFWNQTVVVLDDEFDNASCERGFAVAM